jgi:cyclopropane-fatty-acyl-phospholipid synthase
MARSDVETVLRRRYGSYFADGTPPAFEVCRASGETFALGSGEPLFTLTVNDERGAKALRSLDQFQIVLAYLNGSLDIDGDMLTALKARGMFRDIHPLAWAGQFLPTLIGLGKKSDANSISAHYDRESEFFLSFLDTRHRCYTQGMFASDDESLENAMTRKMATALDSLELKPGARVLEVGSGWGAFMEYAASRGINVTATTLSVESENYLTALIERESLSAQVCREHFLRFSSEQPFDAIVNMGVTEHLPNYPATIAQYGALLKPGGRVYLDALAMRSGHRVSTFMKRYIYPGRSTPLVLHKYLSAVARSPLEVLSVDDERHNYYLTCLAWARRLDANRDEVTSRWGEQLYRSFRLFLWGSAAGFDSHLVQAYRWVLRKPA